MAFIVDEDVERYAAEHSTPDADFFRRLEEETRANTSAPQMMVGPLEGQFLGWLVRLSGARAGARDRHVHRLLVHLDGALAARGRPDHEPRRERGDDGRRPPLRGGGRRRSTASTTAWGTHLRSSSVWRGRSTSSSSTPTRRTTSATTRPCSTSWRTTASSSPTTSSGRAGCSKRRETRARWRSRPSTTTWRRTPGSSA